MSKINVNTWEPESGSTLTIGDSGDTVNIAGTAGTGFPAVGDGDVTVAKLSTSVTEADNVKQRVCKAWMTFNTSSGTPAILDDFNFSSITDNGVGNFTVNFTTAMADANYAALISTRHADGVTMAVCPTVDTRTTSSYKVFTVTAGAVAFDPITDGIATIVFGDSA